MSIPFPRNYPVMKRPQKSYIPNRVKRQCFDYRTKKISQQRLSLPIYKVRRRLVAELEKNDTTILIGETGSGKTTQVPQYLHELKLEGDGIIGITQPRRVAAITVANRVSCERESQLGHIVGYCVRFDNCTSDRTKIKYVTDGMLLREAMQDNLLKSYNIIILDEAHERTIHTDVLFGIVKSAQKTRKNNPLFKPLKLIIMSATMDVDHFCKYFNAPCVYLEGRTYPVEVHHAIEPQDDYLFSCLVTIFQIHREAPTSHDILVFLTGQEEIEAMASNIRSIQKDQDCTGPGIKVHPLYAALRVDKQLEIFQPINSSYRKIILSTNIAETSVTISGIKYVIDSGMVKQKIHHPATGLDILKVHNISQAQAWQRTGRAGRDSEGYCYRTFTKEEFAKMQANSTPEILRSNLAGVVLQLLALNINILTFDFLDKPPTESIVEALVLLKHLKAVTNDEEPKLTELGKKMSSFPLDPRFSKVILSANEYGCLEEVLSIIALLSCENIFVNNFNKKEEARAAWSKFASSSGDHITLLNIFNGFINSTTKYAWCYENFVNNRNLDYASKVLIQLIEICQRANMSKSSCMGDFDLIRKCFLKGFFTNIAELQKDKKYVTIGKRHVVGIHPSSCLSGSYPPLVIFTELIQTGKCYMKYVMPVEPEWVNNILPVGFKLTSLVDVN